MKMKFLVTLMCGALLIGLSGCPVGVDRTMLIIHGALPLQNAGVGLQCLMVLPPDSSTYRNKGVLELSVGQTSAEYELPLHLSYPFTDRPMDQSIAFPNYGKTMTANNLSLREAEFIIENEEDLAARLATDAEFDWENITQNQEPFFVPMPYTSPTSNGDYLGRVVLPLDNLVVPPILGDKSTLMVHLVVRAQTLGGNSIESSVFHFPIEICNGCLSNITCPQGTVATPVPLTPCVVGQDDPLVSCLIPLGEED